MRAFVTGIGGQDAHYLSRLLIARGYDVVGCGRPGTLGGARGAELRDSGVRIVELDLYDLGAVRKALADLAPNEIYNLAGHSFVPASWEDAVGSIHATSGPALHLLEAVRLDCPSARFYQSSTSEIFGLTETSPQAEDTPVAPSNPYAAAKVFAHQIVGLYRKRFGIYGVCGILYNHESPRRPPQFVSRKIVRAACRIKAGKDRELRLGDLDAMRDWGYAEDYVEAIWRMLRMAEPADLIIGTGVPHTVRDWCRIAFERLGLDFGEFVHVDADLQRPGQPTHLLANPAKAEQVLSWRAATSFERLVEIMVDAELEAQSGVVAA